MKKFILNILLLVGIAGFGVLAAWLVKSGNKSAEKMSPEETVEAFYSALLAGKWDEAREFCAETGDMDEYCRKFMDCRERLQVEDSLSLAVASDILSNAGMSFSESGRKGNGMYRTILDISAGEDIRKAREVLLEKEGGVWLVSRISAVQ